MKRFNKRGTAVPFFTPIIAIILVLIILICSFIWNTWIDKVEEHINEEQSQEYVSE